MEILATFKDGRQAIYTYSIFELLMSDDLVVEIVDLTTGEVLKCLSC